ncbi:MAG: hypothetical protein Q9160_003724 [Pyrenula sp. 1 TL-2023]
MHLRPYNPRSDLSASATVMARALVNDELAHYLNHSITTKWTSYRSGMARFLPTHAVRPGAIIWVVESDPGDPPPKYTENSPAQAHDSGKTGTEGGEILGFAIWSRHGTSPVARNWQRANETLSARFEATLLTLRDKCYYNWFPGVDPTKNRANAAKVRRVFAEATSWDAEIFPEYWELDIMMVDERYWRRGVGRMLLEWGTGQAGMEGVPAVVMASPMGKKFYERGGFVPIERQRGFDELFECGEEGTWTLIWEPEEGGKGEGEGRWVERMRGKMEEKRKREEEEEREKERGEKA